MIEGRSTIMGCIVLFLVNNLAFVAYNLEHIRPYPTLSGASHCVELHSEGVCCCSHASAVRNEDDKTP